jgi:hypothetical protein
MAPFDELQSLWQSQQAPAAVAPEREAVSLAQAFRRYGRRQDAINIGKFVLLALQLFLVVGRLRHDPLQMFGLTLADCSAVYFILSEWRSQRAIARLNFAAPSRDFVRNAIARLTAQRHPFKGRQMFIMMGGFWLGCTAMLVAGLKEMGLTKFLIREAAITVLPFVLVPFGNYLRAKRWNHECRPLVERLTALLEATQERSE